jgi:hypothetical protein
LVVNPGDAVKSQAFVTDSEGRASVPRLSCGVCTITAQDPRGLFSSKTTEFDGQSSSVTLTLQVRPIVDTVGQPGSKTANVVVYGPAGSPLPRQRIVVRPRVMTLEQNWLYMLTTDSEGCITARLLPGEYDVAALLGDQAWEAPLGVTQTRRSGRSRERLDSPLAAPCSKGAIVIHLSMANTTSR